MNFDDCRNNADRDKYGLCAAGLGKCESDCVFYMRTKKPTNADRFRSMTDVNLAKILIAEPIAEKIPFCQNKPECSALLDSEVDIPQEKCLQCALDWLRQPAEESSATADK